MPEMNGIDLVKKIREGHSKDALPIIMKAAQSNAPDIREAAIQVLGDVGDATAVATLLSAMDDEGELSQAAFNSLAKLEGNEVDAAIAKALDGADSPVANTDSTATSARCRPDSRCRRTPTT